MNTLDKRSKWYLRQVTQFINGNAELKINNAGCGVSCSLITHCQLCNMHLYLVLLVSPVQVVYCSLAGLLTNGVVVQQLAALLHHSLYRAWSCSYRGFVVWESQVRLGS